MDCWQRTKFFLTLNSGEADSDQLKYGHGGEERSGNIEFLTWYKKELLPRINQIYY
jgi:hypothetical protein